MKIAAHNIALKIVTVCQFLLVEKVLQIYCKGMKQNILNSTGTTWYQKSPSLTSKSITEYYLRVTVKQTI